MENEIVSDFEWLKARAELLKLEKAFSRAQDDLSSKKRTLPWRKVQKDYSFEGCSGIIRLKDLFQDKSQLIVYHFMFAPGWKEGCTGCSHVADTFEGLVEHLGARDVSLVTVSRA